MPKLPWIGAWPAPRALWCVAFVSAAFALSAGAPVFWWLGLAGSVALSVAFAVDAFTCPRPDSIEIVRLPLDAFALRRCGVFRYTLRNDSSRAVRAALVEAPVPLLNYDLDVAIVHCPPHAEATFERPVTPVARGSAHLDYLYVWYESPLALLRRRVRLPQAGEVRVYPDLSAVERYGTLTARNRLIEAGVRRMRLRGAGTEPESVREFSSGDSYRAIEWKATARRGRLMVSQYEVERSQNVMVLLDAGRLMTARVGDQRKFDYAITAALSVAGVASLANDKVGLVAFASRILAASAPRPAVRAAAQIAAEIHGLEPRFEEADYSAAFLYVRQHVRKRSLVILFTDMVDPAAQSTVLAEIAALSRRHFVVCAFMNDAAVQSALEAVPQSAEQAFATGVALQLRHERRAAAASLERLGVRAIDVPAASLTTALIEQYLLVKQRGLL